MDLDSLTLVYLDQNAWGYLLEGSQDESSAYREPYEVIKRSAEELNYVYPYSMTNLMETGAHLDRNCRENLYKLIFEISGNYSMRNSIEIQYQEIYSYVFSKTPYLWDIDVRQEVFGKGAIYPHGGFRLKPEGWLSEEERSKFHQILQSDVVNEQVFDSSEMVDYITEDNPNEESEYVERLEEIREGITPIGSEGSEQERVNHVISSFKSMMLFDLIRTGDLFDADIGSYIREDIAIGGMLWFYAHFPSFYTYAHLSLGRLSHTRRKIEYNDLFDIMSLSVATPYCDIVTTEQFFGGMLRRYGIGELYDTDVYLDITRLTDRIKDDLDKQG